MAILLGQMHTATLKRPEWNLLALAIILGHRKAEDIMEEYKEDFGKILSLLQVARESWQDI